MRKLTWRLALFFVVFAGALAATISLTPVARGRVSSTKPTFEGEDGMPPVAQATSAITRRLYEGPDLETWDTDISPDGRYLTQTDWETGDLAVVDLLTGHLRHVTDYGTDGFPYVEMSSYSPDGSEIAYTWCCDEEGFYEVRAIGVDGSGPHVLLPPDPERWTWPGLLDWSPDGEYLLLDLWLEQEHEWLALASVRDGSLELLLDWPVGWSGSAAFSPDGRFIAFDKRSISTSPEDREPEADLMVIPVSGGEAVPLLGGPSDDQLLGWEPDGRGILFYSDRDLTEGVWRLPVIDGRAAGEPELIKGDLWRLDRIGVVEGRVYYGITTERPELYTVGIDIENARILSPPIPVEETPAPEQQILSWSWSPDGSRLAYERPAALAWAPLARELVIRSLPGDPARTMPLPIRGERRFWWAPDGRSLVLAGPSPEDPEWRGLFTFDLQTGAYSPIETSEGLGAGWLTLTRDLQVVYYGPATQGYRSADPDRPDALWARNLETGAEREVARISSADPFRGYPSLSPDGGWVARFNRPVDDPKMRTVEITSTESGKVREVYRHPYSGENAGKCGIISWSPDGEYLVIGVASAASDGCTLQRLPVGGGDPAPMGDLPSFSTLGTPLSPLGTRFAFIHGEWRGEIWVMEYGTSGQRSREDAASRIGR